MTSYYELRYRGLSVNKCVVMGEIARCHLIWRSVRTWKFHFIVVRKPINRNYRWTWKRQLLMLRSTDLDTRDIINTSCGMPLVPLHIQLIDYPPPVWHGPRGDDKSSTRCLPFSEWVAGDPKSTGKSAWQFVKTTKTCFRLQFLQALILHYFCHWINVKPYICTTIFWL